MSVKVRPLRWATPVGSIHTSDRFAETPMGRYRVRPCGGGYHWLSPLDGAHGVFGSIEAAQDAAQADYVERILSALEDA